jgi:alkylated DNA repair dioxygenase AlkB
MLTPVPLDDADLSFDAAWLAPTAATALLGALVAEVPWSIHRIRLFGREVDSPRLSAWIGDPGTSYVYSRVRFDPQPWPAALAGLRARLSAECGVRFNSVLVNRYRDGRDAMGWHSDDEAELGSRPVIASVSLGATRRFLLKHRRRPAEKLALALSHGSLLVMRGDTQANFRHALPRTAKPVGERINLTFRTIFPK